MLKIAGRLDEKRIDGSLSGLKRDLEYFGGLGVEALEIPVHGLNVIRHGLMDRELMREAVKILAGYDFTYGVHAPDPVNLMNTDCGELHRSVLRSTLEFASELGAGIVVCHAGQYISNNEFPMKSKVLVTETERARLLALEATALRELSAEFQDVAIVVENARPYLLHSPYCYAERAEPLLKQITSVGRENVGVNLDVGHLYLAARFYGFDLFEELRRIQDMVIHCHVHDNFGLPNYYHEKEQTHLVPFGRGDCHMPVGWGEAPIKEILTQLAPGFGGMLVLELRGRYYESVPESLERLTSMCLAIDSLWNRSAVGE